MGAFLLGALQLRFLVLHLSYLSLDLRTHGPSYVKQKYPAGCPKVSVADGLLVTTTHVC